MIWRDLRKSDEGKEGRRFRDKQKKEKTKQTNIKRE